MMPLELELAVGPEDAAQVAEALLDLLRVCAQNTGRIVARIVHETAGDFTSVLGETRDDLATHELAHLDRGVHGKGGGGLRLRFGPAAETAQPAGKPVENAQCTTARANLQMLASTKGPIQQDTDGDGKPDTVLDDTGRENQRNLAEAAVKAYCTSAGT